MSSDRCPASDSAPKAALRDSVASVVSGRCAPVGTLTVRLLLPALLSLALAGCSLIPSGAWSRRQTLSPSRASAQRQGPGEKNRFLGSLFRAEEPEPLRTTDDWMALEQIRP